MRYACRSATGIPRSRSAILAISRGLRGSSRCSLHVLAEAHEEPGAPIVNGVTSPGRVETAGVVGTKSRLPIVEVGGAELARAVRDKISPRHLAREVTQRVGNIHDACAPRKRRRRAFHQDMEIRDGSRLTALDDRCLQMPRRGSAHFSIAPGTTRAA